MPEDERVGEATRMAEVQLADVGWHRGISSGRRQRGEASQSDQVVGGTHQIPSEVDALQSSVARLAEPTDRFHPAEDFLDPLAHLLTRAVAGPTGGPSVDGAASASHVLR